jgi:Second Messenger Oligonucleotide or Dinucleotide Synthetase domain
MTSAPALVPESKNSQLDDLLGRICDDIQLSPTRYQQAVDRYSAVCRWLEGEGSALALFRPSIYPQGSMRIGTTVKPLGRDEYDLDFVCEFQVAVSLFSSPLHLLNLLQRRLQQNGIYSAILEMKNRCIRLNYANEFHMDILPACPDQGVGNGCLVVPDGESRWWKPSNPKGYAAWFEQRCELAIQVLMAERARIYAKAEPIPEQEATAEKATLKRVVQLLKRWRDMHYQKNCDIAPISMVLTTLAAQTYRGQLSVSHAMSEILAEIVAMTASARPRIYVLNPANPEEDLSERWEDPEHYMAFVSGIRALHQYWSRAMSQGGIHNVSKILEDLFGEPVRTALTGQANHIHELRARSALRITSAGLISANPASGLAMKSNTFHGW